MAFEDLERRRAEVERHRENSARLAHEFHKFNTTGQGSIEFPDACRFDITFIEEPFVTYGAATGLDDLADQLNLDPGETPPIPICTGLVTDWDMDDRGFYVGAWVAARVYFPTPDAIDPKLQVSIDHHFTFTAIGMKDIPLDVRD